MLLKAAHTRGKTPLILHRTIFSTYGFEIIKNKLLGSNTKYLFLIYQKCVIL